MSRSLFKQKNETVLYNFTSFCLAEMNHIWVDTCRGENYYVKNRVRIDKRVHSLIYLLTLR